MALTILAKISPSNNSPYFFLWELKSEAQTLSLTIFLYTFFWPIPLSPSHSFSNHSWAEAPFLIPLCSSQSLFLPLRSEPTFLFLHTLAWQLLSISATHPDPEARCGLPTRYTSGSFCLSFSDSRSVKGTQTFQSQVFSQPTGMCKTHLKKFVFHSSNSCPYTWNPVVPVSWSIYKIYIKKDIFSLVIVFGGWGF